jgi:hypothetical protein
MSVVLLAIAIGDRVEAADSFVNCHGKISR